MNGDWLTLGAIAALAAAGAARRGSRNDETELVVSSRSLPALRQKAELALPDTELAHRLFSGGDVLGELTFAQAAVYDPRRIDALISQQVGSAFAEVFGAPAGGADLYLTGINFARQHHDGALPASALVSLVEENLDRALFSAWPRLPGPIKAHLRANLGVFDAALDRAAQIARQAARATRGTDDNVEWSALAEHIEGHKPMLRTALAQGLPGPIERRRLGGHRPVLPGPDERN